jgi:hypothetical protein
MALPEQETKVDFNGGEKEVGQSPVGSERDVEVARGHLREIEVELDRTIQEKDGEFDVEAEHSPYPEGMEYAPPFSTPRLLSYGE